MLYVEYIRRDLAIPLQVFRHHGRQDWASDGDLMIANLGRTMKIGPEPAYMTWWKIPTIRRMDEWEAHFRTPEGRLYMSESPVPRALDFYRCGLFDALIGGDAIVEAGLHLVEFFAANEAEDAAVTEAFQSRAAKAPEARLAHVLRRLGMMAPDPGGIALWSFADYGSAEPFLRRKASGAATITAAGLYRRFGEDIP